jgi:hypothetical protein
VSFLDWAPGSSGRWSIVERGTHAELLERGGRYKELHDRQYRFESELFVNPGEELAPG